jgi:arsenate reductase
MSLRFYGYVRCDTCRKALKYLSERGVTVEMLPIREQPPTPAELRRMLGFLGGDVRRLLNTSGLDYRALRMSERLPGLSAEEVLELLAGNGNLIRRPFVLGASGGVVGFKLAEWARLFGG